VAAAFTAVKNAWNTLKDPKISGWQKLTTVLGTFVSIAYGAKAAVDLLRVAQEKELATKLKAIPHWIAGIGHRIADTAATIG
jgi:hypothetical protein